MMKRGNLFICDICGRYQFVELASSKDPDSLPKEWSNITVSISGSDTTSMSCTVCKGCTTKFKNVINDIFFKNNPQFD